MSKHLAAASVAPRVSNADLVAQSIRSVMQDAWPPSARFSAVEPDPCRGLDMHVFEMRTAFGKVYRIRVSDVTPDEG